VGAGSCFGFEISLEAVGPATLPHPSLDSGLRHVMVIDDLPLTLGVLQRQLEKLGLKVTACTSGEDALRRLNGNVDLVLIDRLTGSMGCFEFAEAARLAGHRQRMILLSNNQGHALKNPLQSHVDQVAQRPVLRSDLIGWLTLPQAEAVPDPALEPPGATGSEALPRTEAIEPSPDQPRRMRILAAEDNKTNRLVFGKMLKSLDVDLQFACDGEEAVDLYRSFQPDLVFMDISMPRMDGKQATRAIRDIEGNGPRVPVIALTAHAMAGDDKEILRAGLDRYLAKPLRKHEIMQQIVEFCPVDALPPSPDAFDQAV
jgi:CheY-like chemotaxis protein